MICELKIYAMCINNNSLQSEDLRSKLYLSLQLLLIRDSNILVILGFLSLFSRACVGWVGRIKSMAYSCHLFYL